MKHKDSKVYKDRISSVEWFELCKRLKHERGNHCDRCGKYYPFLEVHHKTYTRLGHELDTDLEVLCRDCHIVADYDRREEKNDQREKRLWSWVEKVYGRNWRQQHTEDFVRREYSSFIGRVTNGKYH